MKRLLLYTQFSALACVLLAQVALAAKIPTVFVSVLPQKYFVQQISKDMVQVEVMVQPGANPATYEPKPSQMVKLSSCAAYFSIGVPFEAAWLEKMLGVNPGMHIIETDSLVEKIAMATHHHEEDEGFREKKHDDQRILDPHIWLSPSLVKKQLEAILAGLITVAPQHEDTFVENHQIFQRKIDLLSLELRSLLKESEGMRFMVFHPSWGYFAREYGLEQVPIEIEGKAPKPAQLKELIVHARENGITVIFAQPQFSQKSARLVAREIRGRVIFVDPLAENWAVNLKDVAEKINQVAK